MKNTFKRNLLQIIQGTFNKSKSKDAPQKYEGLKVTISQ